MVVIWVNALMLKKAEIYTCLILALLAVNTGLYAQVVGVEQWADHLSYNKLLQIVEVNNRIYCATEQSVFYYDKNDNSVNRLSKVNGLSDVGVSSIAYNPLSKAIILGYSNANIDVIINDEVYNIPDIKMKNILGSKRINNIMFIGDEAYLACGFGIVVLSVDRLEVKDTYYLNLAHDGVADIVNFHDTIFASTESGVYKAPISGFNLSDFNSWSLEYGLAGACGALGVIGENLIVACRGISDTDTLLARIESGWSSFESGSYFLIKDIGTYNNQLYVTREDGVYLYDENLSSIQVYSNSVKPYGAIGDSEGNLWVADNYAGLIKGAASWGIFPNGPWTNRCFSMDCVGGDLWVAPGGRTGGWGNSYISDGLFGYLNNSWENISFTEVDSTHDITAVEINPSDQSQLYAGSWGKGLLEFKDGILQMTYRAENTDSVLQSVVPGQDYYRIGGLEFDQNGNLWVVSTEVDHILSVRQPEGSWTGFGFPGLGLNTRAGDIVVDDYNNKWILLPGNGILVFNENSTFSNNLDDDYLILNNSVGLGNLPDKDVVSIAKDLDGEIWVGTNSGITVFYSPGDVFSGNEFDSQQILIEEDSSYQYLLEAERITAIAVDGANRKWIGTESAGLFLMSEDGTKEIYRFTETNSPLLSDNILALAINHETGDVFMGTDKGVLSFRSGAIEGLSVHSNVIAFPNPVKPEFNGPIAIRGLVLDADVKITDISGNLIYQTKALGGQAIWPGKNLNGVKVSSGIYLVFSTNEDGAQTMVTKVLFLN